MKTSKFIVACLVSLSVFFLGLAGIAGAQGVVEVWPTGSGAPGGVHPAYPGLGIPCTEDLQNVQQAVFDSGPGRTVILHATDKPPAEGGMPTPFNFGSFLPDFSHCVIPFGTTIEGEEDGDPMTGEGMTEIVNGQWAFIIIETVPPTDVEIRKIHFLNPGLGAIIVWSCQDFTAMENRITAETMEGRTMPNPLPMQQGYGIIMVGQDPYTGQRHPEYIYGQITIQDNYIDLEQDGVPNTWPDPPTLPYPGMPCTPGDPPCDEWMDWFSVTWSTFSILVQDTEADIAVRGNHVYNDTAFGILFVDNYGIMMAENNVVELGPRTAYNNGTPAFGIQVFNILPDPKGNAHFLKNTVVCNGAYQTGILLGNYLWGVLGTSSARKNHVTLNEDSQVGIALAGLDNGYIGQNKIEGQGQVGLVVGGGDPIYCPLFGDTANNVLVGNNISNLQSSRCHVYFNTCSNDNVLVGGRGTLVDLGTDNKVKGGYRDLTGQHVTTPGGVGPQISEALRNMHGSMGMGVSEGILQSLPVIPE